MKRREKKTVLFCQCITSDHESENAVVEKKFSYHLNEDICQFTAVRDKDIYAPIVDYSKTYPERESETLGEVNYAQLKSGKIMINGKEVLTAPLSSYVKAKEIAENLKRCILEGEFLLTEPVVALPGPESGYCFRPLEERSIE